MPDPESTVELLGRLRSGQTEAREILLQRYRPTLLQWAEGRLPARARGMADTEDLVQLTLSRVLEHLDTFDPQREGAFLAYLRTALLNALRDEIRRPASRGDRSAETDALASPKASALEELIGRDGLEAYESALTELPEIQREAVMLRLEFRYSFLEIAAAVGSPSANAARMLVTRGIAQLAAELKEHR